MLTHRYLDCPPKWYYPHPDLYQILGIGNLTKMSNGSSHIAQCAGFKMEMKAVIGPYALHGNRVSHSLTAAHVKGATL